MLRQSNCAQWYQPQSPLWLPVLPWMWRAGPSAPCRKGICDAEKSRLTCKETGNLRQRLTRFQVATERSRKSCGSVVHCHFLPLSGLPEGYRSYLLQMATCPRNNRQPVNLLETNRFAYDIICAYDDQSILYRCKISLNFDTFLGVISKAAMVCTT